MENDETRQGQDKTGEEAGTETNVSAEECAAEGGKYPEWDRLQDEVARQLRANQRFLERCLDDEFPEEDEKEEGEEESEDDAPVG